MTCRFLGLLLCTSLAAQAADKSLRLPIGDPARRDKQARVVLDAIADTATGELISPSELGKRLSSAGVVFVGESHTSLEFHIVQKRVIEELTRAGRRVMIGLEMYPYTEQGHLDSWCRGLLTEEGFVELSRWYLNWGYHWQYYRDIFLYARDHGIRMFAVNAPREVVSAVRKKGFQNLTPEEAAHIPTRIDTSSTDHFTLFKAFFEGGEGMHSSMPDEAWKSMFDAQCTWDATMGFNAVKALEKHGGADSVMVVLIGSGHVAYGLGAERQAAQWYSGRMASVIPIPVLDDEDQPVDAVQASYASFVWGVAQEKHPLYPELGFSTTETADKTRRRIIDVGKESVARAAGFQTGDVLLSMDGRNLPDREVLNRLMAEKRWGDIARFVVRRGDAEVTLETEFRRTRKAVKQP